MQQFSGSFTITKKDNLRFNFFLMRKKLIATSALVFVIIFAMVGLLKYAQGAGVLSAILNGALMSVVGIVILVGINVATAVMRINRFYTQRKLTDFTVSFTADKAGIHSFSERGDSDLPWNRILEVRETLHAFYIFITDSHANVMPKDQFANPKDAETFRSLLEMNVAKSRLKLRRA
jgi:hypothetical protein